MIAPAAAPSAVREATRGDDMRPISAVVLCAALLLPGRPTPVGARSPTIRPPAPPPRSHGQAQLSTALNGALNACGNGCLLVTWEHNTCIAFATDGRGGWGDAFNYPTYQQATASAVSTCGAGCAWRVWACN